MVEAKKSSAPSPEFSGASRWGCRVGMALFFFAFLLTFDTIGKSRDGESSSSTIATIRTQDVTIRQGETLQAVLSRLGMEAGDAQALVERVRPFINSREIRAGQNFQITLDAQANKLKELLYPLPTAVIHVRSSAEGWSAEHKKIRFVRQSKTVNGTLRDNLYRDGTAAGLKPAQIMELADIFQYDIDFFSDFQRGDIFSVTFEESLYENGRVETKKVLAAELTVAGSPVSAFHYTDQKGEEGYYDRNGRSLRRAFLRAPLNYRRISSSFSVSRRHPIFRTLRPHLAIDYAASAGTPVISVGSGTVSYAGWRGGYGNLVEVRHPNGYSTRYGHFSRIARGVHTGKRIAQSELIGYVGQTGHTTGPHLHFELLRGDKKLNFLALKIPPHQQLTGEEIERFNALRDERLASLESPTSSQIASR